MELKVEYLTPAELKPYENNAKLHPNEQVAQIRESIERFGFLDPVAIWRDGTVIEGHGRLLAALQMGLQEIPVIRLDGLTDAQRRAYALVHNQLTMNTGFDLERLTLELDKVKLEFDMEALGFDTAVDGEDPEEIDEIPAPEPPAKPESRPGEMWQLGRHRLMCGDSTDPAVIAGLMGGESADLLLTDPPYNVAVGSQDRPKTDKNNDRIKNDDMSAADFIRFLTSAFRNAAEHMRGGVRRGMSGMPACITSRQKAPSGTFRNSSCMNS